MVRHLQRQGHSTSSAQRPGRGVSLRSDHIKDGLMVYQAPVDRCLDPEWFVGTGRQLSQWAGVCRGRNSVATVGIGVKSAPENALFIV